MWVGVALAVAVGAALRVGGADVRAVADSEGAGGEAATDAVTDAAGDDAAAETDAEDATAAEASDAAAESGEAAVFAGA